MAEKNLDTYFKNLEEEIKLKVEESLKEKEYFTKDYREFIREHKSKQQIFYEKLINKLALIELKINETQLKELKKILEVDLLYIDPKKVYSASLTLLFLFLFLGGIVYLINLLFFNNLYISLFSYFLIALSLISYYGIHIYPRILYEKKRILSSQQTVKAVLFVVMYMRNSPNLENAIKFAAKYLDYPLNTDFKKILWDFETKQYSTFKEALDNYLERWKDWDYSFVEAFSLIYNSLQEGNEEKREKILDKALEIVLASNFERMIKYVHNLKNPITAIYMLGVILPVLGLVIMAIAGALMSIHPVYYFIIYDFILPIFVYYMSYKVLIKRPGLGFNTNYEKFIPELKKESEFANIKGFKIKTIYLAILVFFFLFSMGFILMKSNNFLNPKTNGEIILSFIGSVLITASLFFSFFVYYSIKYFPFIKVRDRIKKMEEEFYVTLYQLAILLDENLPFEVAIKKLVNISKNEVTQKFFELVEKELMLGSDLRNAMKTALKELPSSLILSSIELILEAIKKSPQTAATVTKTLSNYLDSIKKVTNRLVDLLAEILSSIKMQVGFMAPFIAAIVVSLQAMTISILTGLSRVFEGINSENVNGVGFGSVGLLDAITNMLNQGTPTSIFQLVVGIYIFELTFILTFLYSVIKEGFDEIKEKYELSNNLLKAGLIYTLLVTIMTIILILIGRTIIDIGYS